MDGRGAVAASVDEGLLCPVLSVIDLSSFVTKTGKTNMPPKGLLSSLSEGRPGPHSPRFNLHPNVLPVGCNAALG